MTWHELRNDTFIGKNKIMENFEALLDGTASWTNLTLSGFLNLGGNSATEISTDGTLAGDSDAALPTEKAVKTYIDAIGSGSIDDIFYENAQTTPGSSYTYTVAATRNAMTAGPFTIATGDTITVAVGATWVIV